MEELGPNEITPEIMDKITNLPKKEDPYLLRHDAKLTTAWIARFFYNLLQQRVEYRSETDAK